MEIENSRNRDLGFSKIRSPFLFNVILFLFVFWGLHLVTEVANASSSFSSFKQDAKSTIQILSACLMNSVSKKNTGDIQEDMDRIVSDADREGKPIRFGIGVLDKNGVIVAGKYVGGIFKDEDFSKYQFVKKAFKKKKIVQERLYFQDHSELLMICVPLIQQKKVIGAILLGFNPMQVKKDYDLSTEQFLTLDFNKD